MSNVPEKFLLNLSLIIASGLYLSISSLHPAVALIAAQESSTSSSTAQIVSDHNFATQAQQAYQAGRYEQARLAWELALAEADQDGDRPRQIFILNGLSATHQELGNWAKADFAIQNSLEKLAEITTQDHSVVRLKAQTLNTQAALRLAMGQPQPAHDLWLQAEQLYRQANDPEGILGSRINQIQALQALGLYRQAYLQLAEIREQVETLPNAALKVSGLKSVGDVLQVTGNLEEAQTALKASAQLAEQLGDRGSASSAWLSLGNAYRSIEQYEAAAQAYQMATQMAVNPVSAATAGLSELALLIQNEHWDRVEQRLKSLTALVADLEPSRLGVYAKVNLANSYQTILRRQKRETTTITPSQIAQLLSTAVDQAATIGDQRAKAYALGQLGSLYEQNRQYSEALDLTERALTISEKLNIKDIGYRWQWQKGRILKAQSVINQSAEQFQTAIAAYQESINTLKLIRSELIAADASVQFSFRDQVEPVYRELVDLLVTPGAREVDLQQARQAIEDLQLAELQNFFRSACLDIQAQQIDQIDSTAAVLYPVILPSRLVVITALPGQPLQQHSVAVTEQTLNQTVNEFLQTLNPVFSDSKRLSLSQTLYQWLVAPLQAQLEASKIETLVFVLDGALRNAPISALHTGDRYLIEQFNLALTPGLKLLPPQARSSHSRILAAAITEAHQGFPALPGVAAEIAEISTEFPTTVFLNEHFTADNLRSEVGQNSFPIVHLATHGQFSSEVGGTFLLGWEKPLQIQDFQVLVRERLPQIRQPIELLVLSACQTAEGDDRAALGLAGFAVRSGARSTLATLWSVNDRSTASLVTEFYRQLSASESITKARALREAQISLLKSSEFSHPFYWAPFVLVGNWL